MNFEQIRQRADELRALPLPEVLQLWGARPDRQDKQKWHTSRGTLSVKGAKFINWTQGSGGGGAIDLVIHLKGQCSFREAFDWLDRHFPGHHLPLAEQLPASASCGLRLPPPERSQLGRVRSYLITQRALAPALIDALIESGTLYAERRANAVFLLLGKDASAVGAELRGTSSTPWRGMAPGSRKDEGYFSIPNKPLSGEARHHPLILCESAIDAISCYALHHGACGCISTSGARPNPAWLPALINTSRPIYCGFDADETGDRMARAMRALHPEVTRLRPPRHDWNDLLKAQG